MLDIVWIFGILRDAVIIGGVGYGIKMYSEMLKAKKAEVELLKARVEHLEKMSAPALVDQIQKMAPLLNEYAKKIKELEEKQQEFPDALAQATRSANAVGIGAGILDAMIAIKEFINIEVVESGLAGAEPPACIDELHQLVDNELMPLSREGLDGRIPELWHLKNALTTAKTSTGAFSKLGEKR